MIVKAADELRALVTKILLAAGADERNAHGVSEHLVSANLCGVDTHGVWHLPSYVNAIRAGEIIPTAWPEVVNEMPTAALISGNWTFGVVAAKYAMEVALKTAAKAQVAVVGLVQAHHIGRLGEFAELAASNGMISMIYAGGNAEHAPSAIPYGGRARLLHTNPMAMGFPAAEEPPMILDFATTALSGVKVVDAYRHQQQLPPGAIVDKDGNPTTDPAAFFAGGAHAPFGGHKGYALMMAVEFLGRIFTGTDQVADTTLRGPFMGHQGVTMIVFKADLFQPFTIYAARADEMERRARAVPPAHGFQQVLVPGDPETATRAIRQRDGIPIADDVWQSLIDLGTSLGVIA